MDAPYCEICGEQHATCATEMTAMCDDCFEEHCRAEMKDLMGDVCCNVSRQKNGHLQICLAPYGVEHEH